MFVSFGGVVLTGRLPLLLFAAVAVAVAVAALTRAAALTLALAALTFTLTFIGHRSTLLAQDMLRDSGPTGRNLPPFPCTGGFFSVDVQRPASGEQETQVRFSDLLRSECVPNGSQEG